MLANIVRYYKLLINKLTYNYAMAQIAVGNQIWNYQEVGSGKGVPILILHGWGRTGNEWVKMAEELSAWSGRKVYVVDLPGFGGSSLPKVKTITQYSELVVAFCKYMEIDKMSVIGHSLGGRVGIILASKYSHLVEHLILIDPAGVKPRSLRRTTLKIIAKLFAWVPFSIRAKMVGSVMDEDYRNSPSLRDLYRVVVGEDLRKYLPEIKCATTIVWGENDPILPLSLTKIYRKLLPDNQIRVVWGAGHDPHLEKFDQTLRILEESVE